MNGSQIPDSLFYQQTHCSDKITISIGQHFYLFDVQMLAPLIHNKGIINTHAINFINAPINEFMIFCFLSRQMLA
jgi:hypothetical protein